MLLALEVPSSILCASSQDDSHQKSMHYSIMDQQNYQARSNLEILLLSHYKVAQTKTQSQTQVQVLKNSIHLFLQTNPIFIIMWHVTISVYYG